MSLQLAHVLQGVQDEMQQDHENQVEMLRLDHLKAMNSMRQRCQDEVRPVVSLPPPRRLQAFATRCRQVTVPTCSRSLLRGGAC